MPLPRPKPEDIVRRRDFLLELWQTAHEKWRKVDEYLHLTYEVWPPGFEERPSYHPARSAAIVNHAVDNLLSHIPIIHRPTIGRAQGADEQRDRVELAVSELFKETSLLEPLLTGKQSNRHLVSYGYTVLEGPLVETKGRPVKPKRPRSMSDDEWASKEAIWENEKRSWMPFRLRAPHPSWILLDPQEKIPTIAIKHAPRYARDLERITRELSARGFKQVEIFDANIVDNPYKEIMCDEWWDEDWHALMTVEGQMLFCLPNPAKFTPYGHAFSGWGSYHTGTDAETTLDPSYLAHGILDDSMESLRANAQFASALHNALIEASFRKRFTSGDAEELDEQLQRGGDTTVEAPDGKESIWMEELANLPNMLFEGNRLLITDIEFATFSQAVAGIREQGVVTVGQQAILSTAANRRFEAPMLQSQHLYTNAGRRFLRLIDMLGEKLTINGVEIGPNDIRHDYSLEATFEVVDPVLLLQEREMGLREHQERLISDEDYLALAKKEDVSGIRDRILKEDLRNMPEYKMVVMAEIAREMGLKELADQMDAQREQEQQGQQNGAANPANSNPNNALLDAGRSMRQGLTPNTPGQPRTGQAFAGSDSPLDRPL